MVFRRRNVKLEHERGLQSLRAGACISCEGAKWWCPGLTDIASLVRDTALVDHALVEETAVS
jgi:hypothetical protein